jgi:hypothetical protein
MTRPKPFVAAIASGVALAVIGSVIPQPGQAASQQTQSVVVTNTVTNAVFPPSSPGGTNPNFVFYVSPAKGYVYDLLTTGFAGGAYALNFVAAGDPVTHPAAFLIR